MRELQAGQAVVTGDEAAHLAQVLRAAPGTPVTAFDGKGFESQGVVVEAHPHRVLLELEEPVAASTEAQLPVTVAVALLKGDKLADVIRQCTELGAVEFQPLLTSRADVPWLSPGKLERLRRVAREAAKQSGRAVVPPVHDARKLSEFGVSGTTLVGDPHAQATLAQLDLPVDEPVTIITGPEGGLSPQEVQALREQGAQAVRLGSRILRAQTAPVALLSALLLPEAL